MQRETRLGGLRVKMVRDRGIWARMKANAATVMVPVLHLALGMNFMWQPSLGKIVAMILERTSEAVAGCHISPKKLTQSPHFQVS